ncbi:RNA polymerase sigma factor [Faecalispora anaeroviscerum]|uniref:RNA polymerase sigma factor n=1 Tax=Faecalispora anaeroviscerum TaxID=2991836 RepID=UPI0024B95CBC|nr:sigma-70 family RNA polymerase sigma factor [Faecalispora anaeroviscerum]
MGDSNTQEMIEKYIILNQNQIYTLAFSYVHNKDDALDIVQESIYKAMTGKQTLNKSESIRPWIYRIVVNTALDFLRRKRREAEPDEDILSRGENASDDHYEDIDLKRALDSLPDMYRSIVVLRYFEDLTLDEIAGILNENLSTVKTRLYKSLKLLRVEMSEAE